MELSEQLRQISKSRHMSIHIITEGGFYILERLFSRLVSRVEAEMMKMV